jgi:hypothetical protein
MSECRRPEIYTRRLFGRGSRLGVSIDFELAIMIVWSWFNPCFDPTRLTAKSFPMTALPPPA